MMIDYSLQDVNFAVPTINKEQQILIKSILVFDIYILKRKSWLIDWLRRRVVQFRIVTSASYDIQTEKNKSFSHKKLSHLRN